MRQKGKLTSWDDAKGFGFVSPFDGSTKVFVHIKAFGNRSRRPELDDIVTFTLAKDKRGRSHAAKANLAGDKQAKQPNANSGPPAKLLTTGFFATIGVSIYVTNLPIHVLGFYLLASMVTFIVYAIDKSAARSGSWRTSEGTLHLLALLGGWPGAMLAQRTLRHKSRKASFRITFWFTVLFNCAGLAWLHTSEGRVLLEPLL